MTLNDRLGSHGGTLLVLIRLGLGLTFVVASWHKFMDPGGFAKIIYGYGIFPGVVINLLAIWVPMIEMLGGLCLLVGVWKRPALMGINFLLIGFILIIGFNLIRGHEFDCGCFSLTGGSDTWDAVWLLVRDLGLLGAGLFFLRLHGSPN